MSEETAYSEYVLTLENRLLLLDKRIKELELWTNNCERFLTETFKEY